MKGNPSNSWTVLLHFPLYCSTHKTRRQVREHEPAGCRPVWSPCCDWRMMLSGQRKGHKAKQNPLGDWGRGAESMRSDFRQSLSSRALEEKPLRKWAKEGTSQAYKWEQILHPGPGRDEAFFARPTGRRHGQRWRDMANAMQCLPGFFAYA